MSAPKTSLTTPSPLCAAGFRKRRNTPSILPTRDIRRFTIEVLSYDDRIVLWNAAVPALTQEDVAAIAESFSAQPEMFWSFTALPLWEELGDPRSREIARRLLQNDDERVRVAAAMILNSSTSEPLAGNDQWNEVTPGVLADAGSNRQWTRADNQAEVEWQEALLHCITLPLAGGGWRLPTQTEFKLIHSRDREELTPCGMSLGKQVNCRVPNKFNLTAQIFWLAAAPHNDRAQGIDLTHGASNMTFASRALCVRDVPD